MSDTIPHVTSSCCSDSIFCGLHTNFSTSGTVRALQGCTGNAFVAVKLASSCFCHLLLRFLDEHKLPRQVSGGNLITTTLMQPEVKEDQCEESETPEVLMRWRCRILCFRMSCESKQPNCKPATLIQVAATPEGPQQTANDNTAACLTSHLTLSRARCCGLERKRKRRKRTEMAGPACPLCLA
jgi:hypothetical protein